MPVLAQTLDHFLIEVIGKKLIIHIPRFILRLVRRSTGLSALFFESRITRPYRLSLPTWVLSGTE
jgi:hypothetical protein